MEDVAALPHVEDGAAHSVKPTPKRMPFVLGTFCTLVTALACDGILELSLRAEAVWLPGLGALVGALLVWCVILVLVGLTGKLRVAVAIVLPLCLVVGAVNWMRMSILGLPIVPADVDFLKQPEFLLEMVGHPFGGHRWSGSRFRRLRRCSP